MLDRDPIRQGTPASMVNGAVHAFVRAAAVEMARVGPEAYAEALDGPHAREMDFTGKPLKGFVYVDPPGFAEDSQLAEWVDLCQAFTGSLPPK